MKVNRVMKMLRVGEWLFSKLPFLFLPILIYINDFGSTKYQLLLCLAYFVYLFTFLGFGYAINDYSDREIDKKIGKTNVMGELSNWKCLSILTLLVLGGVPFAAMIFSVPSLLLFVFVYFWGAAYSVRPFRFKEKGVAGLLVSSLAQRTIPLLPLLSISKSYWPIVCICGLSGFLVGLRYILIHQYEDIENDQLTGTNTYVKNHNHGISKMVYIPFAIECVLVLALELFFIKSIIGYAFALLCVVQTFITYHTIQHIYRKKYFLSFICVPFEDMYNFYIPLSLLIGLACKNIIWVLPIAILVVISAKDMINKWKTAIFGVTHWRNHK